MEPIGCNEEEARRYLCLSPDAFGRLRRRGIILPVQRGVYSYHLLDEAMKTLENEARAKRGKCEVIKLDQGEPEEGQAGDLGSKGSKPTHRPTEELLREIAARG